MMFGGIKLKTFLSTPKEWHALVIGFCEVLCPWRPRYHHSTSLPECIKGEYHYYVTGRALGFVAFVILLLLVSKFVKEALL